MKKRGLIAIIILIIIIAACTVTYFIFQKQNQQNKEYEVEKITDYQYFVSKSQENQKYGVIDTKGNIVIPEEYDVVEIPNPSKPVFLCTTGQKNEVLNDQSNKIYTEYDNIELLPLKNVASDLLYEKSIMKYEQDGKYGLISLTGEVLTDAIYEEIDTLQYKEGELIVKKDGKYGIINQKGYTLVETQYDKITADTFFDDEGKYYYDGYIVANKTENGYRYGYVAYTGEVYLDTLYNDMQRISEAGNRDEAYLLVAENGRYGLFKNEKKLINTEYHSINFDSNNSIFIIQQGKKYGVINQEGNLILPCEFEELDVKGKYLYAKKGEETSVYSADGKQTEISPNTSIVEIPNNDGYTIRVQTEENNTTYQIYKDEQPIIQDNYKYITYLENNLLMASKDEKLGIIDIQGNPKTEFKYTSIQVIQNTPLIQMLTDNSIEITDGQANSILTMQDGELTQYENYILVSNEKENKYVTIEGKEVTNKEIFKDNTLFAVVKDGKWGFEDKAGNIVVEPVYDQVTEFNKYGFAGILKDKKWGMVTQDGTVGLEPSQSTINSETPPQFIGTYHQVQLGSGKIYYTK